MKNRIWIAAFVLFLYSALVVASGGGSFAGGGGGGGVDTVGSFSGSAQTNGASISGNTITFGPASNTVPGMVSTGAQTWAGVKTLSSNPILNACTADTVPYLNSSKALTSSAVTPTELGYLSGVSSALQTQLDAKSPLASPTFTGTVTLPSGSVTNAAWSTGSSGLTVNGVAFSAKAPSASPTFTGTVTMPSGSVTSSAWDTGTSSLTVNGVAFSSKVGGSTGGTDRAIIVADGTGGATVAAGNSGVTVSTNGVISTVGLTTSTAGTVTLPYGGTVTSNGFSSGMLVNTGTASAPSIRSTVAANHGLYFESGTTPCLVRNGRVGGCFADTSISLALPSGAVQYMFSAGSSGNFVTYGAAGTAAKNEQKMGATTEVNTPLYFRYSGSLWVNTTATGNVGAGEDDLQSKTIPARGLYINTTSAESTAAFKITYYGSFAANGNTKRIKVYVGSQQVGDCYDTNQNGGWWKIVVDYQQDASDAAHQYNALCYLQASDGTVTTKGYAGSDSVDFNTSKVVKATASATSDNDVVSEVARIDYLERGT